MKKAFLLFCLCFSCSVENTDVSIFLKNQEQVSFQNEISFQNEFTQSFEIWKKFNASEYSYQTQFFSFSGFQSKTQIEVRANRVISRNYYANLFDSLIVLWHEGSLELNSHQEGALAQNLNAIYEYCADSILIRDPKQHDFIFSTFENGLLKNCFATPKDCSDDCGQGVSLTRIQLGIPEVCTEIFVTLTLVVLDTNSQPVILDEVELTLNKEHLKYVSPILHEGFTGFYALINDSHQELLNSQYGLVEFKGYQSGMLKINEQFIVASDGCHIQKLFGKDTVIVL